MQYVVCLGDSLTQHGYQSGWLSLLSDYYIRRATVLNCGQSGYTSRWYLSVMQDDQARERMLPSCVAAPLLVTLLLGSNDAAVGLPFVHVPLDEYERNMESILRLIHSTIKPKYGIFLLTPPPVCEEARAAHKNLPETDRTFADIRRYRAALFRVAAKLQSEWPDAMVQLVDTHTAVLLHGAAPEKVTAASSNALWEPAYEKQAPWASLLRDDGLHINPSGGRVFFDTLVAALKASPHAAQLDPESVPELLPHWSEMAKREEERSRRFC